MPTDYRHKFWAERLHPATSNWRCRHIGYIRGAELAAQTYRSYPSAGTR
jgi:hypothetical protein